MDGLPLKVTHFNEYHRAHGNLVEYAGFEMPLWFKTIVTEHLAVRNSVGMFDVSHMGRIFIEGSDAERFLNHITANNVATVQPMQAQYTTICNEKGGIKDDVIFIRITADKFLLVPNASNREKDWTWVESHSSAFDVDVRHVSDEVAMIALQGPRAYETLRKASTGEIDKVGRFRATEITINGIRSLASRTGYTGEDGFEIFVYDSPVDRPHKAISVWNSLLESGREFNIEPCGLGARDTLRLEAGLCLYGNDINEETTPLEARLDWVVKLDKGPFIGRDYILKQKTEGVKRMRVGIKLLERGIPRPGHDLQANGLPVGFVTSGTFSPILQTGIAIGYVPPDYAKEGTRLKVKIRDKLADASIVNFPFYNSEKYGWRRKQ